MAAAKLMNGPDVLKPGTENLNVYVGSRTGLHHVYSSVEYTLDFYGFSIKKKLT